MVCKWVLTYLEMGYTGVYDPLTNLLLTSWDIQVGVTPTKGKPLPYLM